MEGEWDRETLFVCQREREIILIQSETFAVTEGVFEALSQGSYKHVTAELQKLNVTDDEIALKTFKKSHRQHWERLNG